MKIEMEDSLAAFLLESLDSIIDGLNTLLAIQSVQSLIDDLTKFERIKAAITQGAGGPVTVFMDKMTQLDIFSRCLTLMVKNQGGNLTVKKESVYDRTSLFMRVTGEAFEFTVIQPDTGVRQ